jgi:predicted site-specific integrase-resolvase
MSRSPEFRREYLSAFDAALKYRMSPVTVTKWVHEGRLSAVRVRQGRLFVERRELAAFVKQLPNPGTKTRAKVRKHRRLMALRRLGRRGYA